MISAVLFRLFRGGVIQVGTFLPTGSTSSSEVRLLPGFSGRRDFWTFIFEGTQTIWALQDMSTYTETSDSTISSPKFYRTAPSTAIVRWYYSYAGASPQWVEDSSVAKLYMNEAVYSLVGRSETISGSSVWVLYATSRTKLYRAIPSLGTLTPLIEATNGKLFRGVALPPYK